MTDGNTGYALLCTDAYILDVRPNDIDKTSSIFDIALPCGNHLLENKQPILVCCLQYQTILQLPDIPSGHYHIRAKVRAPLNARDLFCSLLF